MYLNYNSPRSLCLHRFQFAVSCCKLWVRIIIVNAESYFILNEHKNQSIVSVFGHTCPQIIFNNFQFWNISLCSPSTTGTGTVNLTQQASSVLEQEPLWLYKLIIWSAALLVSEITSCQISYSEERFVVLMSCDVPCAVSYNVFSSVLSFLFSSKSERKHKISVYHPLVYSYIKCHGISIHTD